MTLGDFRNLLIFGFHAISFFWNSHRIIDIFHRDIIDVSQTAGILDS